MLQLLGIPILFEIGLVVILSVLSAEIQRRLGIPQVLGFILTGILLGPQLLGVISPTLLSFTPIITSIALGFIGFNIGNELRIQTVKRDARKLLPVFLAESLGAFFIVYILMFLLFQNPIPAILLGSLASATAPAATADIIWEFKSRGPVTDAVMFILILDDIIAIILTSFAISSVILLLNPAAMNIVLFIALPLLEIGLSLLVGLIAGAFLCQILRRVEDHGRYVLLLVSMVIFLVGIAELLHISDLLTCMICGVVLGNRLPSEAHELTNEAEKIFSPIILIFFVLFGASMVDPALLSTFGTIIIITTIIYVVGRSISKYLGSRGGARLGGNPPTVQRYLGLTLFSQAGVAVGLSVVIADQLRLLGLSDLGALIVGVIGLSTLVFQIFGPLAVKFALERSGETRVIPDEIPLE